MKRSIEERLLNPKPGSKIAAAKEFGIDLTLIVENLRLTPDERVKKLQANIIGLEKFRQSAQNWRMNNSDKLRTGPKNTDGE